MPRYSFNTYNNVPLTPAIIHARQALITVKCGLADFAKSKVAVRIGKRICPAAMLKKIHPESSEGVPRTIWLIVGMCTRKPTFVNT